MRVGTLLSLAVVVCGLLTGCGSSEPSAGNPGHGGAGSTVAAQGGSGAETTEGQLADGIELVGCEQAFDGVDPVAIVSFPEGTKGNGTSVPSAGWAYVEIVNSTAPLSVDEEPVSVTVYAGSVRPAGSRVLGATPIEVEDPEAVTGCRIVQVGTNGSTPQTELEGPE